MFVLLCHPVSTERLFILSQFPAIDSAAAFDPYLDQKLPVHITG